MGKNNHSKHYNPLKSITQFVLLSLTATSMNTWADSTVGRPGTSPEPPRGFPDIGIFRPYTNPSCANHMQRSAVEVINNQQGGTPWYYYTCTFQNNGWCSLATGHCPEQVCHPYSDWIGPWNDQLDSPPNYATHYTCVSIGIPYPF